MNAQGRSGDVSARPGEIIDPPEFITDSMVKRFPELADVRVQWRVWWMGEKQWRQSMRETMEELRQKVNAL